MNENRWAVSLSVYLHLVPVWVFGKSIACVRATTALVTTFGVAGGALALREMRNRLWWSAPLVAGATALLFVHARLGFESVMMASFFFLFLWAYSLYRERGPRWIIAVLIFGAATFYAYTAGQGVMLVTGIALFFSDFRHHVRVMRARPALLAGAFLLALVLASPYVRYRRLHPGAVQSQLALLDSYWTQPLPLSRKLGLFARTYAEGFDPRYWFRPNLEEGERHRMGERPFFPPVFAPLVAIGVFVCLRRFRESSLHRAVLLSSLGVPFSAAAANLQVLRLLAMLVPATLLTVVGLDWLFRRLVRLPLPAAPIALALGLALGLENGRLTRNALGGATAWTRDFGFYGIQWGAPQIFGAIREELRHSPNAEVMLTSAWANRPQELIAFFLDDAETARVHLRDIREWDLHPKPLNGNEEFVMTGEEWNVAIESGKFAVDAPFRTIPYPDGSPGFRFVRLRYSEDATALFAAEAAARSMPQTEDAIVGGERWRVEHSRSDLGSVADLFDGRRDTFLRGLEANPMFVDIRFPSARPLREVVMSLGATPLFHATVRAFLGSGEARVAELTGANRPAQDEFTFGLPGAPVLATRVRIEVTDGDGSAPANVEFREIRFR